MGRYEAWHVLISGSENQPRAELRLNERYSCGNTEPCTAGSPVKPHRAEKQWHHQARLQPDSNLTGQPQLHPGLQTDCKSPRVAQLQCRSIVQRRVRWTENGGPKGTADERLHGA